MLYKKGTVWIVKLNYQGRQIRRSAKTGDKREARRFERELRSRLRKGGRTITLQDFIEKEYLLTLKSLNANTRTYYTSGTKYLSLLHVELGKVNSQAVANLVNSMRDYSPSTINCALRTLRRVLNCAVEWGFIEKAPKFSLVKGENTRIRVLTEEEQRKYLEHCPQPWKDCATIMLGTGLRPGEIFSLAWDDILLRDNFGMIQVRKGKSTAARRTLPMLPDVLKVFKRRAKNHGTWVFPATTKSGHANSDSVRRQHLRALKDSGLDFPPYTLRHTALTHLGVEGVDVYTLAAIAGHSSITMTQRYVHPQEDAILRAFQKVGLKEDNEGRGSIPRRNRLKDKL